MEGIDEILRAYDRRLKATPTRFHRYLWNKIDWRDSLIGIKGPKGAGKTTLMLQHILEDFPDRDKALYVSLDNLWFTTHSVLDLIEFHYTHGGTHLFLDEIHHFPNWQSLLKNLNDDFPGLNVVYSGSSLLRLEKHEGDLSRRLITYNLHGMSFREYLNYEKDLDIGSVTLENLLSDHKQLADGITTKGVIILRDFETYLKEGYYPFYKAVSSGYEFRIQQVIENILENEWPLIEDIQMSTIRKAKKMLMILAERLPQQVKMSSLYAELETDRNLGMKILNALERAGLLLILGDKPKVLDKLSRPEKIYLNNTNLMYALSHSPDTGTIRETFFFNQLSQDHRVFYPEKGDFIVDDKYLFEVGGKKKDFSQIKDIPNSFLAVDDTVAGYHNRIPLWMFGLLY